MRAEAAESGTDLGHQLREGSSEMLRRRRYILGLTCFSSAVLAGVALYQTGVLKKLPEPNWRVFNSAKVNGSAQAYSILLVPDGLLGLTSYAVTACLTGAGPEDRSQSKPLLPMTMGLKLLADAAFAAKLTYDECTRFRAFSLWSLLAAGATFATLPFAFLETKEAFIRLVGGKVRAS